jgi:excisionase family DNA binding protein
VTKVVIETEGVFTVEEAAELLKIGKSTVFKYLKEGKLLSFKILDRTFIPQSEIDRFRKLEEAK